MPGDDLVMTVCTLSPMHSAARVHRYVVLVAAVGSAYKRKTPVLVSVPSSVSR